ncbi:MAG: MmgE/PrpD family protein [Chloroflexi bacterium]|nr:MmgE/PrpD family protein [Chloroflexota bacterium]
MGATEQFARFIVETTFDQVPPKVIAYSKQLMLDAIGCALAGSTTETGKIMTDFVRQMGGVEESTVFAGGFRAPAANAALANGTLCHSMDYDDLGYHGHPSTTMVPVLLALGEKVKASGKETMAAHAVGFEVYGKMGENSKELYAGGWHPTAIYGAMGAVAAASKLLKLNAEQTMNAFGIAASQTCGLKANFGTMTKPLHAGNAARTGVVSAMLAKSGFTGRPNIIEYPAGFCFAFMGRGEFDIEKMVASLGRPFRMEYWPPGIKKYDCCGGNHNALDSIFALIREHKINYEDVESVVVDCDTRVGDILVYPEPQSGHQARFSLHYNMALALLDGKFDRNSHTDERAAQPDIHEAVKKVNVVIHPEWPAEYKGRKHPVTIKFKDGRTVTHMTTHVKGSPENPLSMDELMAKYTDCAGTVLSNADVQRSADLILRLDELDDLSGLMDVLMVKAAARV